MCKCTGRDKKREMGFWNRSKLLTGLVSGLIVVSAGQLQASPGEISQLPLFLATPVQPNIFFLLDDSGSMDQEDLLGAAAEALYDQSGGHYQNYAASTTKTSTSQIHANLMHCPGYNVLAYDPKVRYTPWHGKDKDGNAFADQSPTKAMVNPYTGGDGVDGCQDAGIDNGNGRVCNLLTGFSTGKGAFYYIWDDRDDDGEYDRGECSSASHSSDDYTASERVYVSSLETEAEKINFANWFSYYRKREYVMKRAVTEVVDESSERMGFATINRNTHITKGSQVGTQVKNVDDLTVPVNATAADNKRVLLDNLAAIDSNSWTPLRVGLERVGEYFSGKMTSSALFGYVPLTQSDSALGSSPILSAVNGGTCQQNFAIVMSDGYWNGATDPGVGNADADAAGNPFDGQSYGDSVGETLADVAMSYYKGDLLSIDNKVPAVQIKVGTADAAECADVEAKDASSHPNCYDTNSAQHLVTYTVAFGITGAIPEVDSQGNECLPPSRSKPVSDQNWPKTCDDNLAAGWPTPISNTASTVDDMLHAAWNGRGLFLSAKNPQDLIDSLREAISDIATKNPVAAAAVAVDSASIIGGGFVYQGKFDSTYWSGELYSYAITTDGISTTPAWNAQALLDASGYSTRIAVTYNGSKGIPFEFPANYTDDTNFGKTELSQAQVDDLMFNAPYSRTTEVSAEITANQEYGKMMVSYLLGDMSNDVKHDGEFRNRNGHKLGDIIHSAPIYVGDPNPKLYYESSYQKWAGDPVPAGAKGRQKMIYVGANDGGLHAFDAASGKEVFVYFPKAVFSTEKRAGLHYLADRGYEHHSYVDGEITVAEVYADVDGTGEKWRTILIGTLRSGGRSIFAIDVSDPSEFTTATGVANNILWEFSDTELGFTFSKATVARMNNSRWAAIFGNGYNPGDSATGEASLFIKYLDTKTPSSTIISTKVGSNGAKDCLSADSNCNGLSTPSVVDLGSDRVADLAYAGDLFGNVWVFDLTASVEASWGLKYATPLFTAKDAGGALQPITSQLEVILHPTERHSLTSPNTMVYFGTGRYLTGADPNSTASNTFYGVWDSGSTITSARNVALVEQTVTKAQLGGEEIRIISNNPVDYQTYRGWYIDLPDTRERVIATPFAAGKVVVFNTIVPESNVCSSSGGTSWLMALDLLDGSEPDFIALDVNGDGVFDGKDQSGDRNVSGIKSGNLNWQVTPVSAGGGKVIAIVPSADMDSYNMQMTSDATRRSSWGRYMME